MIKTVILIGQSESLPNIKGSFGADAIEVGHGQGEGNAIQTITTRRFDLSEGVSNNDINLYQFDASKDNSTYKDNGKVNPNCITVRYWKRVA